MQISKKLPQFERYPALFISSGEYEAHFHIAFKGSFELVRTIKMEPRVEAKEKQGFEGRKAGMKSISAFSHHGRYVEDLKERFSRNVHRTIQNLILENKLNEIYLFAPKYVANRIMRELDKSQQKKVRMQFFKEYTKENPIKLIEIFESEIESMQKIATATPKKQILLK
ncbi:MAG: hypothetical protein ACD_9C00225G0004 [uncultured bacterium]|nr:MAG: hypothetical protein ACD_9C00225G0004 [uncultured bacterium]